MVEYGRKVGIVADSHGQPGTIKAALALLRKEHCQQIVHLGDICDSYQPETVEACVRLIQDNGVVAIKGNNDHMIVVNHQSQPPTNISKKTVSFLQGLPLVLEFQDVIYTHSLPFSKDLGLPCMIWAMEDAEVKRFFLEFPRRILFRGHSHAPLVTWEKDREIISQPISVGQNLDLTDRLPCVVTCGALTRGFCMVWNPESMNLVCLTFL
jgi:predicted phosphodiesterase